SFALGGAHTRKNAQPIVHTVLRTEFDERLARIAESVGAVLHERVRVRGYEVSAAGAVTVLTDEGSFTADCVIGADGANSVIGKGLNSRDAFFWQTAIYCEAPERLVNWRAVDQRRMHIDWGTLASGYAWAFPKNGFVNVGAGGPTCVAKRLP